mgnify:CR=1 FL=1
MGSYLPQRLVRAGLLVSTQGTRGGYTLSRPLGSQLPAVGVNHTRKGNHSFFGRYPNLSMHLT